MNMLVLSLLAMGSPAAGSPDAGSVDELRAMVADLQKQVDTLKSQTDENWLTQQRADQIKGLVQDVLADADTRSSLLQGGAMAGWDKGFYLSSADGNYLLKVGGQLQVRFVYDHQHNSPTDDNVYGFDIRRAKLKFSGHVFDPTWEYELLIAGNNAGGGFTVDDNAWIQKDFGNGLKLKMGQMKAPYTREEMLSSTKLFAVERSLVNAFFTAGTVQGIEGIYETDQFRVFGMFYDGNNSKNTAWNNSPADFAFGGRVDWKPIGEWKSLEDYDGFRGGDPALDIGLALQYQVAPPFGTPAPEVDNFGLTADATYIANGWSIAGAFFYRNLQNHNGGGQDLNQYGFLVKGGYFLTDSVELYLQYEWADADLPNTSQLSIFTGGITKYWNKHALKWQSDIGFAFDGVAAVFAQPESTGWRTDAPDENGQVLLRTQIQLLF